MELKKSPKADLESKKALFTEIGLVATLFILFIAFEWKSYDRKDINLAMRTGEHVEEEMIIQTDQATPPPPPPPPAPTMSTEIEIVDNSVKINNEVEINAESDEKQAVETTVAPVIVQEEEAKEEEIFTIVEENPGYPGGDEARMEYLRKNIKYPVIAKESGVQGTVYVTFVVEKDGSVTDVKVLRGIGGGCDEEAVRVVKEMPKWTPGKQRGKAVRVQFSIPIKFALTS